MAELLVKAVSASHPDPIKDRRGCYKAGDVVVVMPDGHEWGRKEKPPKFRVVKVPGVPIEDMEELCAPQAEDDAGTPLDDAENKFRRRRWHLDMSRLPAAARNALEEAGVAVIATGLLRTALRRKRDDTQFPNL